MTKNLIQSFFLFLILGLVQVLVGNNISLFNIATPFVFIYFLIRLPLTLNKNLTMAIAFLAGLIIDIFSDTQGMNALACTILAVARIPILKLYVTHNDDITSPIPSSKSLGVAVWLKYLLSTTLCYCLVITFIESFTIDNYLISLYRTVGSTIFSFILLFGIDIIVNTKNEKRL